MRLFWRIFWGAVKRVIPRCGTQAQAVAFNMFLAFFPALLVLLGVLMATPPLRTGAEEMLFRLLRLLPPGSRRVVTDFLQLHGGHPWSWVALGLGGTLLAGTQMMKLIMDGFRMVYYDSVGPPFWRRQGRALLLLAATVAPWFAAVSLTVFGKQVRGWWVHRFGESTVMRGLGAALFFAVTLATVMFVLAVLYWLGRPGVTGRRPIMPGATVATLLLWITDAAFGFYVRRMPYRLVYGGLAAAIGLMLWMQLVAIVVFIGAAFNAELEAHPPQSGRLVDGAMS